MGTIWPLAWVLGPGPSRPSQGQEQQVWLPSSPQIGGLVEGAGAGGSQADPGPWAHTGAWAPPPMSTLLPACRPRGCREAMLNKTRVDSDTHRHASRTGLSPRPEQELTLTGGPPPAGLSRLRPPAGLDPEQGTQRQTTPCRSCVIGPGLRWKGELGPTTGRSGGTGGPRGGECLSRPGSPWQLCLSGPGPGCQPGCAVGPGGGCVGWGVGPRVTSSLGGQTEEPCSQCVCPEHRFQAIEGVAEQGGGHWALWGHHRSTVEAQGGQVGGV